MSGLCGSPWELCDNLTTVRYSVHRSNDWSCTIELCDRCAECDGEALERAGYTCDRL